MTFMSNNLELTMTLNLEIAFLSTFVMKREFLKTFPILAHLNKNGVAEWKNRILKEAARTMLSGSVFSKQYWIEAVTTTCYTQNRSTIVKRHLKTPYEIFYGRLPNISFLHVFGCPVYIHNHKDYLGKFDEKADDGYFLGYSLVSKAFRLMISPLLNQKDIHLMKIFITLNLLKGAVMLTRAMIKELSDASTHECLFVDFISEKESKKVSEALKYLGWADAMQEALN
ncbi:retrovirus-related pol polyprotein from transposon TNT 1-94 [Tanacetum coccineum]